MKILTFFFFCFASVALADDFKAIDGKEYKNVTVSRVEPDGIVLMSSSGISKVYFTNCPKRFRNVFITMPRRPPHTRPSKLPVRRRFKTGKPNYDGNWPKKNRYWTGRHQAKNSR
jgi:hypothetical protein